MTRRTIESTASNAPPSLLRLAKALGEDIEPAIVMSAASIALIEGRGRELGLDLDAFVERASADREECARLRRQIVPAETWFFRYPASFEHLRACMGEKSRAAPMRIASLGCATGAEAFSIAAALDGVLQLEIIAVDRDAAALSVGRCGRLGEGSVRGAIPSWARGSLRVEERRVIVEPRWRERVDFMERDLLDPALKKQLGVMDAVFCRNVAIYLGAEARRRLGVLISAILRPGGWLYLGHAETASTLGLDWPVRDAAAFAVQSPLTDASQATMMRDRERHEIRPPRAPVRAAGEVRPERRSSRPPTSTVGAPAAVDLTMLDGVGTHRSKANGSDALVAPPKAVEEIRLAADEGRQREALAWSEAAFDRGERSAELLELLGTLCLVEGRRDDARRHLRAALYLDSTREAAAIQLALLAEMHHG